MRRLGAWWLSLLLLVAPVFDRQPLHRDLVDYFLPMYSASLATGGPGARSWLNPTWVKRQSGRDTPPAITASARPELSSSQASLTA